jgi:integrase
VAVCPCNGRYQDPEVAAFPRHPRCIAALRAQQERLQKAGKAAGDKWQDNGLVFASETGTELDAANVRRGFRRIARAAGLNAGEWTPRELRHSFVSLLSSGGLSIEQISRLVGHANTTVTETVYRFQLNPVVEDGATAMDRVFPVHGRSHSVSHSPGTGRSKRPGPELR